MASDIMTARSVAVTDPRAAYPLERANESWPPPPPSVAAAAQAKPATKSTWSSSSAPLWALLSDLRRDATRAPPARAPQPSARGVRTPVTVHAFARRQLQTQLPGLPGSSSETTDQSQSQSQSQSQIESQTQRRPKPKQRSSARARRPRLPSPSSFAFATLLRGLEKDAAACAALGGIAELYARSKLCLADEYAAHRPPASCLVVGEGREVGMPSGGRRAPERRLTTVTERSREGSWRSGSGSGSVKTPGAAAAGKGGVRGNGGRNGGRNGEGRWTCAWCVRTKGEPVLGVEERGVLARDGLNGAEEDAGPGGETGTGTSWEGWTVGGTARRRRCNARTALERLLVGNGEEGGEAG